ncbi:MAG: RimK family alpha-L-glutamate ligase [Armatimonadetes bacterium]|nr:RimK family alpha-L-glutamate ligase [Armatimonadota bacterium]
MMTRIAIVCAWPKSDPAAHELLAVRRPGVRLETLESRSLGLRVPGGVTADGAPLQYDAYLVRSLNPWGCIQVQYDLIELLSLSGYPVINQPHALSLAESKLQTSYLLAQAGIPTPRTVVAPDGAAAEAALAEFGRGVVKPIYGALGEGLLLLTAGQDEERLKKYAEDGPVYIQEYLPAGWRDLRILVLGGRMLTAAYREAAPGEWRANVSQGGRCVPCEPSRELVSLAIEAARVVGLDYAGVDLIEGPHGYLVVEVNGSPGWQGVAQATGCDVAGALVDYVVGAAQAKREPHVNANDQEYAGSAAAGAGESMSH